MKYRHLFFSLTFVSIGLVFPWFTEISRAEIPGQGTLTIVEPDGKPGAGCPLEHTSVKAEVSGFISRVSVVQRFHNPGQQKIEAIYTFPLPNDAAVNEMLMRVGDRLVRGEIKKREEARQIYQQAKDRGHVASLLDQERPNIFTQSVANIMPGEKVEITIKYVEMLPYNDGSFKFVFPMVVGPRFIPGQATGKEGAGWAPDTNQVPDAGKITPPVTAEGTRAGHDIDVTVSIDAGVPIEDVKSKLHEIATQREGNNRATVTLKNQKEIPNRDFVLEYLVAGDQIQSGFLAHKEDKEGHVALIMIPPKRVKPEQISPKEMIFVIDRSGSQHGKPLDKAKETMKYVIDNMNPDDTFNVIDFANTARMLFSEPKKNSPETRAKAIKYIYALEADGGTWMGPAVEKVCQIPPPENRLRIVTFMTDGYVGNDFEIISLVQKLRGKSRWFPFGAGNGVNRFLLDNMARVGGGEVDYVLLNRPGEEVAKKFYKRIAAPVLTDISLAMEGISLEEVFPGVVSDLWDSKPIIFKAKYSKTGKGSITIKGFGAGKPYEQKLEVNLPERESANLSLASLWARAKVDDLMDQDLMGVQRGKVKDELREEIIRVALEHRIMTQFTSFVAVEETVVTVGGKPTTVAVPVEMPDGVSRERVFGDATGTLALQSSRVLGSPQQRVPASMPASGIAMRHSEPRKERGGIDFLKRAKQSASPNEVVLSKAEQDRRVDSVDKEELKIAAVESKLARELRALVQRKDRPKNLTEGKVVVKDGKIVVQVWLTRATDDILKKLKEAGLEVSFTATTGKMVLGVVDVDRLSRLVEISEVRLVEPAPAG
ncbi:MAG: VIT and vWA domain-containing protein [Desulfomonilaceae bacterium]